MYIEVLRCTFLCCFWLTGPALQVISGRLVCKRVGLPTQCTAHTMAILCSVLLQTARFSKSRFSQVLKYTFFLNRTAQIFFSIKILFLIFSHFSWSSEVIIFCFLEWSFAWLLVPPHVLHVTSTMAWLYAVSFFCFFTLFLDSICR